MSEWERIDGYTERFKIPGGWLVRLSSSGRKIPPVEYVGITFVPDPLHKWDLKKEEAPEKFISTVAGEERKKQE